MVNDNIECAFPNVEISLHIFFSLMLTNCLTECSFSQLKHEDLSIYRTTMRQEKLGFLSLLVIEPDLLCKIDFMT